MPPADPALDVLRSTFGFPAFRGAQRDIIDHVTEGGDALVLMPTGGGKSLCYQIPALLRPGTAVVVSPLIALMQDQVAAMTQVGIRAAFLNSTLDAQQARDTERAFARGQLDLLYIAPERLATARCLDLLSASPSRCSRSTRRIASRSGAMISARTTCSCPYCMNAFPMCRALP